LPRKPRGAARIWLERIERVGGYPTSQDGIGRGAQTAGIWFRADHLQDAFLIQGTSAIELGCGTHLDVMPSVQIFSAVPGQPVRGKISLLLIASGGHLGGVTPRSAQTGAMLAAAAGAGAVVARLGALGKALQASIRETIEDAAAKVFARAQPKAPPHLRPRRHAAAAEHHLASFDHILGERSAGPGRKICSCTACSNATTSSATWSPPGWRERFRTSPPPRTAR